VINADVLDAWFPPAPGVVSALQEYLPWLLRTSPPQDSVGLVRTIAYTRGIPDDSILVGAGSSSLIYLAFRQWLTQKSRVLLLDPTYGEYAHVLEQVIGCRTDRFRSRPPTGSRSIRASWRRASNGPNTIWRIGESQQSDGTPHAGARAEAALGEGAALHAILG